MKARFFWCGAVIGLLLGQVVRAQTSCGNEHRNAGVFICYPNPSLNAADATLPQIFHLSAQGNAPDGKTIARYTVAVDNHIVYENRMITPVQRLAIELNLKSSFTEGVHTLRVAVDGAGVAEVEGLRFLPAKSMSFCEPVGTFGMPICSPSNQRPPLAWTTSAHAGASGPFAGYLASLRLYRENLESLEADAADAVAVDAHGNLYVALHSFADVELRKYAPDGSIVYDSVIRSCSDGWTAISGLAVDEEGHAWIAGNTTACLAATHGAVQGQMDDPSRPHGFVMMLDTSKPNATAPLYATYLAGVENRIAAIRVDDKRNAYVAGVTSSPGYPHDAVLRIPDAGARGRDGQVGFVSMLNESGLRLLWSTVLPGAQLTALAVDRAGTVFVTGSVASPGRPNQTNARDVLIAGVSASGRRLSYLARLRGPGEGRAISVASGGRWLVVAGEAGSPDDSKPVAIAAEPCKTGISESRPLTLYNDILEIAVAPALDTFTAGAPFSFVPAKSTANSAPLRVQIAPACLAEAR
jgi:hypothetical protein